MKGSSVAVFFICWLLWWSDEEKRWTGFRINVIFGHVK